MGELFACSRMYNVSPEVTAAWDAFYAYVQEASGVRLEIVYHSFPDSIEELWSRPNMGCVLMCGYPYTRADPRPKLIAAPVPSPAHYENRSVYFSHLLVAKNSSFKTIEETFGQRICWTIENSQSGFNAIRSFLLRFRSAERPFLYRESIGPIGTFTVGVEALRRGEVEVVPIDSFSYDLMQMYTPALLADVRIIATTPSSPFPPLVAGHDVPDEVAARIKTAVLQAHQATQLKHVLSTLMIKRFTAVEAVDFESMIAQAEEATAVGYLKPA